MNLSIAGIAILHEQEFGYNEYENSCDLAMGRMLQVITLAIQCDCMTGSAILPFYQLLYNSCLNKKLISCKGYFRHSMAKFSVYFCSVSGNRY